MAYKGYFKPQNPTKYAGDPNNIVYRSNWEKKLMLQFDSRDDIIYWASEELAVPYFDPFKQKWRRYFPDFIIKTKDERVIMIEVKPYAQTQEPPKQQKKTQKHLKEVATFRINSCKWESAMAFCKKKGWEFQILHEKNVKFK